MNIFDTHYFVNQVLLENNKELINPLTQLRNKLSISFLGENKKIDTEIENIGNFADETNLQLIFELLQNADDANNDKDNKQGVFGLFTRNIRGANYLLAINNGKPFDTLKANDNNPNVGYFHKFLAGIGKANTAEKKKTDGKFGKGSKLLYNLFIDNTDSEKKVSEKRKIAIIENLQGPIICSWQRAGFLESLTSYEESDKIRLQKDHDYPLVSKIINAYYPAYPNEKHFDKNGNEINLFNKSEITILCEFLKGIDNNFYSTFYNRGSLIFIKLGDNQDPFNSLEDEYKFAIRNYLSFSKNLTHIYFNNEKILKTDLHTTGVFKTNNHQYEILFPNNDNDILNQDYINFYNQLPVVKETHGLKFIINSDEFDILDTRQNISFKDASAIKRLDEISREIIKYIENTEVSFKERILLYKAIIASDISKSEKTEIKDFYKRLIERIKSIVPIDKSFTKNENILINNTNLSIQLSELNLGLFNWINTDLQQYYKLMGEKLSISSWNLFDVLNHAKTEDIKKWLTNIDKYEYSKFINEFITYKSHPTFEKIPFIRSSNNEIHSLMDYKNQSNYFILPQKCNIAELLLQTNAVINENLFSNDLISFDEDELNKYILFFNSKRENILPKSKSVFVQFLSTKFDNSDSKIKNDLEIFKNINGNYCKLSNLFNNYDISKIPELINFALISPNEHASILDKYYLHNNLLWNKIIEEWDKINLNLVNQKDYIDSILKISSSSSNVENVSNLKIIPDVNNDLCKRDGIFLHSNLSDFNSQEYNAIIDIFESLNINIPSFDSQRSLIQKPFFNANTTLSHLKKNIDNNLILDFGHLIVFRKIITETLNAPFFTHFIINEIDGRFKVSINKNKAIQYYSTNNELNNFLSTKTKYNILPSRLNDLFKDYKNQDNIINELIEEYGAKRDFLNVVITSDSNYTKKLYIDKLESLSLFSNQDYLEESFEYQVINLSIIAGVANSLNKKIKINEKPLSNFIYRDNIYVTHNEREQLFKLSEILPLKYEGNTDILELLIKKQFKNIVNIQSIFSFKSKDNTELLTELDHEQNIFSPIQMAYVIANNIANNNTIMAINCKIKENNNIELLELLYSKKIVDFSKYFSFGLDLNKKILTKNKEYLLLEEETPSWVLNWINEDDNKRNFVKKYFIPENPKVIKFRKNYLTESNLEHPNIFLKNTLHWLYNKAENIINIQGVRNVKKIIQKYSEKNNQLPPHLLTMKVENNELIQVLKENNNNNNSCYIANYNKNDKRIIELINNSNFRFRIIENSVPSLSEETFNNCGVSKLEIIPFLNKDAIREVKEWDEDYYLNWRQTKFGKKYTINILDEAVPLYYKAKIDSRYFEMKTRGGGNFSYIKINDSINVYLNQKYINKENKPILTILEENKNKIKLNSDDLLKLNSIYISQVERLKNRIQNANISNTDIDLIARNKNQFKQFLNQMGNGKSIGNVKLDKDLSSIDQEILNKLLKKYSPKDLNKSMKDKSESDAKINSLTGYIGEMVFDRYLKIMKKNDIKYVADQKVAEYDFVSDDQKVFIDTKTTIKPVKGQKNAIPFYIKASQYNFLIKNKPDNYFIARLSLRDLGLERLKSEFIIPSLDKEIPEEIKNQIKIKIKEFYKDQDNIEKLKNTMMTFKINFDDYFNEVI